MTDDLDGKARSAAKIRKAQGVMDQWSYHQGLKIKAERGYLVWLYCWAEAKRKANYQAIQQHPMNIKLDDAEIEKCRQRCLSQKRVQVFGPIPKRDGEYEEQMRRVHEIVNGEGEPPKKLVKRV